jgi:hypothetical protein
LSDLLLPANIPLIIPSVSINTYVQTCVKLIEEGVMLISLASADIDFNASVLFSIAFPDINLYKNI